MTTLPRVASLSPEAFTARLAALGAPGRFAIAVSGGRDSMALARLCGELVSDGRAEALALIVDHGLRAGSAAEARQAAQWCADLGLAVRILDWRGPKPETGIQAEARSARYRLLIEAAAAAGCAALMTAHTRSDQAETLLMRITRGAGVRGCAAMRARSFIAAGAGAPLPLLRPLLDWTRAEITEFASAAGQPFLDDPSNADPRFERVRMRALLAQEGPLSEAGLGAAAGRLAEADQRLRRQEDLLFDRLGGCFHGWGGASLARWDPGAAGSAALARRLFHAAGGAVLPPEESAAAAAMTALDETGAASLAGALVQRWRGRVWFFREPAAVLGRAGIAPLPPLRLTAPALWDRRFILAPGGGAPAEIRPLGREAAALLGDHAVLFDGPPEALAGLPGVFSAAGAPAGLIAAPALPFMQSGNVRVRAQSLCRERYDGDVVRFA